MDSNNSILYCGMEQGDILAFEIRGKMLLSNIKLTEGPISDLAISNCGQFLFLSESNGVIIRDLINQENIH